MAERTVVEILRAAKERISDPSRWTRGAIARDESGRLVSAVSLDAACWCARGAICREAFYAAQEKQAISLLESFTGDDYLPDFNDGGTPEFRGDRHPRPAPARHRRVLEAFDRAIELAEARP